ncbi:hypothetical protein N480_19605 [Pseudoalteromonas luteoviolacea S2607]|uniref:hypothetical protein n=1 Tax=Pseudoalteromonas luteoviolacea TaxID=43657 RepID=UPI0007B04CC5|nr:hypothetical protein [Pseudoalteromonas luteoviolacea]KZN35252.1 hypothetical protein N480_19605 [Pseudoalteromonas luteoviolacea S2607]
MKQGLLTFSLLTMIFVSLSTEACRPCSKDVEVFVLKQASIVLEKSRSFDERKGYVTFIADIGHNTLSNLKITEVYPEGIPESAIKDMIQGSKYRLISNKKGHIACEAKAYELSFAFRLL